MSKRCYVEVFVDVTGRRVVLAEFTTNPLRIYRPVHFANRRAGVVQERQIGRGFQVETKVEWL